MCVFRTLAELRSKSDSSLCLGKLLMRFTQNLRKTFSVAECSKSTEEKLSRLNVCETLLEAAQKSTKNELDHDEVSHFSKKIQILV